MAGGRLGPSSGNDGRRPGFTYRGVLAEDEALEETVDEPTETDAHDLIVIGATGGALSVAVDAQRAGLANVRVLASGAVAFPSLVTERQLDVGYGEDVQSIDVDGDLLVVTTSKATYRTRACLAANRMPRPDAVAPIPVAMTTPDGAGRVHVNELPGDLHGQDVLVVGSSDHAVELTSTLTDAGNRVVLAGGDIRPALLSPAGDTILRRIERERQATILYRSMPDQVGEVKGFPMAFFGDRRTPDLQFDHVVFASSRRAPSPESIGVTDAARAHGGMWFFGADDEAEGVQLAPGWDIWNQLAAEVFPEAAPLQSVPPATRRRRHVGAIDELRAEHYNATITRFEPSHSDLWVLRVKPDNGDVSHDPGQYASLGLGYWEDRIDDAEDIGLEDKWDKLVRRSYSISSPMFDEAGYLADSLDATELEFYIVLVQPTPDNVPGLTPRLALKRPGDRIYLGPKVAGRYTTAPVTSPDDALVFLSTGTGEAPHNAMVVEMLRKGHVGPIVSAVTVRQWVDLGYRDKHELLAQRYPNYHYVPLPTREADVPKRYIQDLISGGDLEQFGVELNPTGTHVFLCGNPAMIGIPEEVDGELTFPETTGVVELLVDRGFVVDSRTQPGNIHFEEYW